MAGKEGATSPHEKFFYHRIDQLRAVQSGKWKRHPAVDPTLDGWDGVRQGTAGLALSDLETDIGERTNLAGQHPEVVARLRADAAEARRDTGNWQVKGGGPRIAGWNENPVP